jgi:hypothetical protein
MSDIYTSMDVHTLQINWALKRQQLAEAESEGAAHQVLVSIYRELKAIQYYLSLAVVRTEEAHV